MTADASTARDTGLPADSGVMFLDARPRMDASSRDATAPDTGEGKFSCDPLAKQVDPGAYATISGQIVIFDFYNFDEDDQGPHLWRNFRFFFGTGNMQSSGAFDGVLYASIDEDTCVALDVPTPQFNLLPRRNIGTRIDVSYDGQKILTIPRAQEADGPTYFPPSGPPVIPFGTPTTTRLSGDWIWSSPGDPAAGVRPTSAVMSPVEDFAVTPAFTSTSAPMPLDPSGMDIQWTAPVATPGIMTIIMSRSSSVTDSRYVVCRPMDDGQFTLTSTVIASLGATPGLAFDFSVARGAATPFCNEGVASGVVAHSLVHFGAAVVP